MNKVWRVTFCGPDDVWRFEVSFIYAETAELALPLAERVANEVGLPTAESVEIVCTSTKVMPDRRAERSTP